MCVCVCLCVCRCSLEDFDGEEVDEEALIEQRRQQRLAIVQVCYYLPLPTNTWNSYCLSQCLLLPTTWSRIHVSHHGP